MTQEEKDKIFDALDTIEGCHPNFSESIIDNTWCEAIRLFKGIISKMPTTNIYEWFKQNLTGKTQDDEATILLYTLMLEDVLSISKLVSMKEAAMKERYGELKEDASNVCAVALMYKNKTYEVACKNSKEVAKEKEKLDSRAIEVINKLGFFKVKVD